MHSPENKVCGKKSQPRFSLNAMLVVVAGFAVVYAFSFALLPELWLLITETPSMRNGLFWMLGLIGVFVLVVAVGIVFRLGTLLIAGAIDCSSDK